MAHLPTGSLLRLAGLSMLALGAWDLLPSVGRFVMNLLPLGWDATWMLFPPSATLPPREAPLLLCLGGAGLYVLAGLSLPKGRQRRGTRPVRFDFSATFAPYLVYESFLARALKCLKGVVLLAAGAGSAALLYVVGHDLPLTVLSEKREPLPEAVFVGFILSLLSFVPLGLTVVVGLRYLARGSGRSLRGERRRPFLYLRSFEADAGQLGDEEGPIQKFVRVLSGSRYVGYEERLVRAVTDIAPLVAIGRPGEKLPPLGAARLYVREDWQRVVTDLIAASRAVFLRIGHTKGFWWEVRHVVENCDPQKVIICLPWRRRREMYAQLRRRGADVFPRPLPPSPGDALFLTFDADWSPRLLPLTLDTIRFPDTMSRTVRVPDPPSPFGWFRRLWIWRVRGMRNTLNGALLKLGIPRRPMPLTPAEAFLLLLCFVGARALIALLL
jgi:hypothetical protein